MQGAGPKFHSHKIKNNYLIPDFHQKFINYWFDLVSSPYFMIIV